MRKISLISFTTLAPCEHDADEKSWSRQLESLAAVLNEQTIATRG